MSLQIWLPLMEDFHNLGLANITVTEFNTPTFIAGKLGQCCHLSQSSSLYLEVVGNILNTTLIGGSLPFSVCFWIKNEETLDTTNRAIICGDYSSSGWNIEIRNTANGRIRFYWSGDKVSDSDTYSYSILQNEWMHIAVIYTGSLIIIYKNGMNPKITTTTLAERTKTNSKIRIGRDYRSSPGLTYFTGCLNDFRIYDNALSAKEVEEIAKGLVLHYKLNGENQILVPSNGSSIVITGTVYDSSGYQNNGTITGSLTCNTDTPRYNLSTNFNAYNNYITVNNFTNTLKNITNGSISWWQKGSLALSLLATGYSGTGGTYFIMATNSSKNFYHQNSGTITVYKNGISGAYKITVGEWDFYCITGVNLSTWSTFRLNYYSSTYHIGSISDLRIYATILTESQIQELYNTSALIDNVGNIYSRELVQV